MKKIVIEVTDDIYKRFTRDVSTIDSYTISKLKQVFNNSKPLDDVIEEKLKDVKAMIHEVGVLDSEDSKVAFAYGNAEAIIDHVINRKGNELIIEQSKDGNYTAYCPYCKKAIWKAFKQKGNEDED